MEILFRTVHPNDPAYIAAVNLRETTLRKALRLPTLPEPPGPNGIHIVGVLHNSVVATAILVPQGKKVKMQRVAVEETFQNLGIGSQLLTFCEHLAVSQGYLSLYCHARDSAVKFYLKNGYVPEGSFFEEDTIPHLKMVKMIAYDLMQSTCDEQRLLDERLGAFNVTQVPSTQAHHTIPLSYCFKKHGHLIGGITAELYLWKVLYIAILYIEDGYRQSGLGSYLLAKVENEAKKQGARLAHTDTYDFQAKDFYLKQGYQIFGILEDCPDGHARYYLKKKL